MTLNKTQDIQVSKSLTTSNESFLIPKSLQEGLKLAEVIANSELAPQDYRGKPANVLIAVQMGLEVGLQPMQAIQNIAIIKGRPCLWGDALLAIVQASGLLEDFQERTEGDTAYCTTKRKGYSEPYTTTFSDADAKAAGLLNKSGPWSNYKARMRQMRARAFNLRDQFADVIKGLNSAEEVRDYEVTQKPKLSKNENVSMMPSRKSDKVDVIDVIENEEVEDSNTDFISDSERRDLFQLLNRSDLLDDDLKSYLKDEYGVDSSQQILKQDYNKICDWIQSYSKSEREPGEEG